MKLHTAEPSVLDAVDKPKPVTETKQEQVLEVNAQMLLENPKLLSRAMYSAVMMQNVAGIKVLLPIYEQWPQHDKGLAKFGRALVAQSEGKAKEAVALYRELIAEQPDAAVIRMQLAQALFEDQQNEAAIDQFDRLQSENLPDVVRERIAQYREALRKRDAWQVYGGINIAREQNINQAPKQRRLGNYLNEQQCADARKNYPSDDCFRGWTFDAPIDATVISYQAGAEKKWSLNSGFYTKAGVDIYGKSYPSYSRYNDITVRVTGGVGYADQRNDVGVSPFHERRIYGNDAYSYTNGARLHWNRWLTPRLQTLTAVELGRLKNIQRERSDITSQLVSGSLVFYSSARQYWLLGTDFYKERNGQDRSDNFNRYGVRAAWGQEWGGGLSSRVQVGGARRLYDTPTLLSDGARREDKEWNASVSLWHRAVHLGGITPRLTFSHNRTSSNDVFHEHSKNRAFVELTKAF
ncbi:MULTISPECIES: surface lipoprotein assembly modifier [unclassified Neisseria]|uniref:surface lipoprotein assembly modifier n=1 Tax=unclassified Neisseria TaxID=2623750 RepID=UPI00266678FA|nr:MULTISPECIES: surface lipoprotein assembly modifier [unclassified Neisseria]MDO1508776.1 surface lipoprotein assembly modifier [Neisseria sp. MVDL19-042950]MDO1515035.1 surface lipoprotein assembly modifier [Neisseria sp. MVDL18-041461]MDO1562395.1 surface lipoprotein assembly modifier [Neisseria sp. MVDL20-010259]